MHITKDICTVIIVLILIIIQSAGATVSVHTAVIWSEGKERDSDHNSQFIFHVNNDD